MSPQLARGLRTFGFRVVTLEEVYGDRAESVQDTEWIEDCGRRGYAAFTANPAIIFVRHEKDAILTFGTRVFCLANAQHNREGRGLIFGRHMLRILRRRQKPGPCFWRLYPSSEVKYDIP